MGINKWKIYVGGITIETEATGDFKALKNTGLFTSYKQVDYFMTKEKEDMWVYNVEINGKYETALIKRVH